LDNIGDIKMPLSKAIELESIEEEEKALDRVYSLLDDLLLKEKYAEVDDILCSMDVVCEPTSILIAITVVTWVAHLRLKNRKSFIKLVVDELKAREEYDSDILEGLIE
jgi:hypothetical protein